MSTEYDNLVNRAEIAATNAAASSKAAQEALAEAQQIATVINEQQATTINNSKEAIRQAIVSKGQDCDTSVAFDQYADKIMAIEQGSTGVDTSSDTVTADKMLDGVTAHDAAGNQITGNIISRSLPNLSLAVDADSGRITATYTAETGYYRAGTVDAAETMDVQAATEYTPGTSDIVIPAYKFLTGTQTIKGDSNLTAANIKKGVAVFGVNGSYEASSSGGTCKFYECTAVDNGKDIPAIPAVPAGITVTGFSDSYYQEMNGHYSLVGEFTTMKTAVWKHDTADYYIGYGEDYSYWCLSYGQSFYPWDAYKYVSSDGTKAPWEYDWSTADGNSYGETIKLTGSFEDKPEVPMIPGTGVKSWSGYEWLWDDEAGYTKASDITTGLSWTINMPEVGNTYTEDGLVRIQLLYNTATANPLTFTAEQENSTVKLAKSGTVDTSGIQYRYSADDAWQDYSIGTNVTLVNVGDTVQFKNSKNQLSKDGSNYINVQATGKIAASGNIQSMLNYEEVCGDGAFAHFFENCTALTQAPNLPAKSVGAHCYSQMFYRCSSLKAMPVISATKFTGEHSCHRMFGDCTSLTKVTPINATEVGQYCYNYMFSGCSALETPPALNTTKFDKYSCQYMFENCSSLKETPHFVEAALAEYCYQYMFRGCSSLTTAHKLPSLALSDYCYSCMFSYCSALTTAPELPATTLARYCYEYMFRDCTSLATAPELPATTLANYCYSSMFSGCTSLTTAPDLPATTLADYCYSNMFYNCSSLTTAPELLAETTTQSCYYYMFGSCTNLKEVPLIAAKTIASSSLSYMFVYCSNLNSIKVNFTSWDNVSNWMLDASSSGTFYKPDELPEEFGYSRIPNGWTVKSINESEEPEEPTPEEPTIDVAFTVAGCSVEELNGDWIEESSNVYIKADDSTKKCTMDYGPGFWHFWSTVTEVTLVQDSAGISNPWDSNAAWYSQHGEYAETSMTVTKAGTSGGSDGDSSADFGTYLKVSNAYDGMPGIYKLNEEATTATYKEWVKLDDPNCKVKGNWSEANNGTYWVVFGGISYYANVTESSISNPWTAGNTSLTWYYQAEVDAIQVVPVDYTE